MAKQTVAIDLQATTKGAESVKSLKQQIKEAQAEAILLARKFGDFSPEATKAADRVAKLRDEMEDFQQRVAGLNPDKFGRFATIGMTVANGFQAAQGAMALFGAESEDVQKQLAKVQGAIAFAQGIDGILAMSNSLKAMGAEALAAFKKIRTGLLATGIGVFVAALGTIVAYWDDIKEAVSGVSSEQEKLNEKTAANLKAEEEKLTTLDGQDNILKLQGKSELDILKLKKLQSDQAIKQAEIAVANAEATKTAQVEAAKRNKDLLQGIIKFITAPLQLLLKTVDLVGEAIGKDFNLQNAFNKSVAELVFDPAEVEKKGDESIAAAKKKLQELKNINAGFQLQINAITENAAKEAAAKRKAQEEKENEEAANRLKNQQLQQQKMQKNIAGGADAMNAFLKSQAEQQQKDHEAAVEKQVETTLDGIEQTKEAYRQLQEYKTVLEQMGYQSTVEILGNVADLFGRQTAIGKAFALAEVAANEGRALAAALANTQSPTPDNIATGGLAGIVKFLTIAASITGTAVKARNIIKGGQSGGGLNMGQSATMASPSFVPLTSGMLPDQEQAGAFAGMGKVYVLEGDITNTQRRVRRIKNVSVV